MGLSHQDQKRYGKKQGEGEQVSDSESQLLLLPAANSDLAGDRCRACYDQNGLRASQLLVSKEENESGTQD